MKPVALVGVVPIVLGVVRVLREAPLTPSRETVIDLAPCRQPRTASRHRDNPQDRGKR